ncbi:MAG TPA: response regulator [Gemmatimonadaceae bacterium]|nr:response regulator [Gemmatimonadaceae bacterium]
MKVLVADDDTITRALVKRAASQVATSVIEADNGLDALDLIRSEDPDILITDLRMPIIDGFELIATLRAAPAYKHLPIICLSAISQRDEIERLASIGITDYVLKPPKPSDITDRISRIMRQQSHWKSNRARTAAAMERPGLLLVDPDQARRDQLAQLLKPAFDVIAVETGIDALREFRERDEKPAIILVAERLPILPEEKLPEFVRRLMPERATTVVVLLADDDNVPPDKAPLFDTVIPRSLGGEAVVKAVREASASRSSARAEPAASDAPAPHAPVAGEPDSIPAAAAAEYGRAARPRLGV